MGFFDKLLNADTKGDTTSEEALRVAATALLFRALNVDGEEAEDERATIRRIIEEEFALPKEEVQSLMQLADSDAKSATDIYGWIRLINREYSHEEKLYLMEKLWQVVLADGRIDSHESSLMRRVAGLIYVSDRESAEARHRAQNH
ncbi:MAG: TerB family tellurite resistance protein [Proteobacteria bacterium]|nr:TerB family tellurite resistance protein [Pseudomonadota bacterium]